MLKVKKLNIKELFKIIKSNKNMKLKKKKIYLNLKFEYLILKMKKQFFKKYLKKKKISHLWKVTILKIKY